MNRILEISESTASIRSENGLLRISSDTLDVKIPFEEIAVLILANNRILISQQALSDLASVNGIVLVCNDKFRPSAMLIPLEGNYEQTKKMACQADASLPVKKQIWKTIVQAKLRSQAGVLRKRTGNDCGLLEMSKAVGSGDPGNLEAVAAARYWKQLLGNEFVRHNEDFRNSALNYGYAILRSIVARCLCASGLHPSLGVHHKNQRNPFCLADDVMEPFRPIVDNLIAGLKIQEQMTKETKQTILSGLMEKFGYMGERSTLFEIILRISQALAKHFTDGAPFDIGEISGYNVRLPE